MPGRRSIRVIDRLSIDEGEIEETFVLGSGPGGQNVNKVASAVQLRFDIRRSPSLPEDVKERLVRLAGRRVTSDGVLVISARRFRSQDRNRADALQRLVEMLREAAEPPVPRRPTRPSMAERRRRREDKGHRAAIKALRRPQRAE
ncbi:MAG: aminoacyl-tRNA hydrolase [Pseudomonadota bacterium]|nr:aminoacyl-tRNA hydrolase [Pseudomonadota bacterium]